MRSEAHQFQKSGDTLGESPRGHSAKSSVQFQELARGKPSVEAKVLWKKTDLASYVDASRWRSKNQRLPARGLHEPKQHFYGSALPRAVWPEEAKDFAAPHSQRKIADGHLSAIDLAQILRLNGKTVRLAQWGLRALVQRVRQRNGVARPARTSQAIDDAILDPNHDRSRSPPIRWGHERPLHAVHSDRLIRSDGRGNRQD